MDFSPHSELDPCQNQCIPKDPVNDPMNPFTSFLVPPPINFGTPRSFHNCMYNFNVNTDIPRIFHELSVALGICHSAGLCVSGPQFTFETSHSAWVTPEFKSILSQEQHKLHAGNEKGVGQHPEPRKESTQKLTTPKDQLQCCIIVACWQTQ